MLERLARAGLKLKPAKCSPEVVYLRFIVSKDGIKTDPGKVEPSRNFPGQEVTLFFRFKLVLSEVCTELC